MKRSSTAPALTADAGIGSGKRSEHPASQRRLGWRVAGGLGWLALLLGACIIEEREFSQQLFDCWEYCDQLDTYCTGNSRVYSQREACEATCELMDPGGDIGDSTVNSLSCRLDRLGAGIESQECPLVGPGGGGACGTNCQALCALRSQVCRNVPSEQDPADVAKCESDCLGLYDRGDMDALEADLSGDTVQCRLAYASLAAISPELALEHCPHSQIRPAPGENPATTPCSDPPSTDVDTECEKYCQLVTTACTGSFAVYQSEDQCLDACTKTMVPGEPGDERLDTIRCRRYHAYFSLLQPEAHCLHASPTGDGHCGTENCTGYCRLLQAGCGDRFATEFGVAAGTADGGLSTCVSSCMTLDGSGRDEFALPPGVPRYALNPPPTGNTLLCRAYHAVEALTDPASHCEAAFGRGACQ
jgi:hypothetical protein